MEIKLDEDALKLIALFETVTRAEVRDCIASEERVIFIVGEGQARAAMGERGQRLKRLRSLLKKNVEVIEWSGEPERFIRNIFHNFKVRGVRLERRAGRLTAVVEVDPDEKARAIGKGGRNLYQAREILARHFGDIDGLVVA
ncbi:MAG: NusA-like transcription termination signal-binding factor [Thermoplasmata archaeon]